jgi:hypothetical protein
MNTKLFSAYKEAAAFARDLAEKKGQSIRIGRQGDQFFVEIPDGFTSSSVSPSCTTHRYEYNTDPDYLDEPPF